MVDVEYKGYTEEVLPNGYVMKHTSIGWWVDGAYGYLATGYHHTREDALKALDEKIADVKAGLVRKPAWYHHE